MSTTHTGTSVPPSTLGAPVGALLRPASTVNAEDSLDRAAFELRRSGNGLVVIVSGSQVVGILTEKDIVSVLDQSAETSLPVDQFMSTAPVIRPYMTGAEALRHFESTGDQTIVVADDQDHLLGLLSPSDLFPRRVSPPRPSLIGGMATPFGVYLTNGAISGGVGSLALMATGALLFFLLTVSQLAVIPLVYWMSDLQVHPTLLSVTYGLLPILIFMGLMRLIPLSGTHAAEHMVVHALERGEELSPSVVGRMPRVHPRCGTNLAVGAMLFLGIFSSSFIPNDEIRFMFAALVTLFMWRRLGSLVQFYVTTKPPKERQIRSGLKAGHELLERYARSRVTVPSIPIRIWKSGMLQVIAGSFLCYAVVAGVVFVIERIWNVNIPI